MTTPTPADGTARNHADGTARTRADDTAPTALWRVVAAREVTTRLREKAFTGFALFTIVLVVAGIVVASFVAGRASSYDVAVLNGQGTAVVAAGQQALRDGGHADDTVKARTVPDAAAAERLVRDGTVDAALLPRQDGYQLLGDDSVNSDLQQALTVGARQVVLTTNAGEQGVDLQALNAGTAVQQRLLDPGPKDAAARAGVAIVFAVLFLFTALGFGMQIAQSVVVEKESRIVEILAAAMPIRALLWGKILGNTLLAVGQIVATVVAAMVTLVAVGRGEFLASIGPAVGWYLALFLLGFVALASLWSVAGALASRQQDLQSTTLPGQALLFIPYLVAVTGGAGVKTVFSMLPIVSTMIMPGRIAQGGVPLWQIGVAILTTVLAAVVFVRIGERVYTRTLLRTGGKIGYREALTTSG